jgi:hypothetical protein
MVGQSIWWVSIALELFLLVQGFRARLVSRYPAFYCYVGLVFLQDIACFLAYQWGGVKSLLYHYTYWTTEFLCVVAGCGVVIEVYRVALAAYPGTARMARTVLGLVFALALAKDIASAWADPASWSKPDPFYIESTLRTTQAAAILGLVALFLLYAIPFGRNLRGILVGYGSFIGLRAIFLVFFDPAIRNFWYYAYSASYLLALGIWVAHLWAYGDIPAPRHADEALENDYQRLAGATRRSLLAARGQLAKAVRP